MDKNINRRLHFELFVKKEVTHRQNLYTKYYDFIWPCEEYFIKFVNCYDSSLKLSHAKKIFSYLEAFDDIFVPISLVNKLITIQTYRLSKNKHQHISQDHIVHSINLYILLIYLFFNLEIFQKKLLSNVINPNIDEQFILLIKKIRLFALYHDIGYIYENLVDNNNMLDPTFGELLAECQDLKNIIAYKYTTRSVAKLITAIALLQTNKQIFTTNLLENIGDFCDAKNGNSITSIKNELQEYNGFKVIENIRFQDTFKSFIPFNIDFEYLIICKDQNDFPVAFLVMHNNEIERIFYRNKDPFRRIFNEIKTLNILKSQEITCAYCIKDPIGIIKRLYDDMLFIEYKEQIDKYYSCLPHNIRLQFSFASSDSQIQKIYYNIYAWLIEKTNESFLNETILSGDDIYNISLSSCLKTSLKNEIIKKLDKQIKDQSITLHNTKRIINEFIKNIKSIDLELIEKRANEKYINENGISSVILYYYYKLYSSIKLTLNNSPEFMNFYKMLPNNSIELLPFTHLDSNLLAVDLYKKIIELAKQLNISIEQLKNYKTSYSACDHGVVSASLLYQTISIVGELIESLNNYKPLIFAWNDFEFLQKHSNNTSIHMFADVTFAILLHNIYTKNYAPEYGIEYRQDIDINPFSYMCALGDILQKWNRAKQIDFSALDLPNDNYIENDYDIRIFNEKINIICNSSNSGNLKSQLNQAEDYLPGITNLIKISEEEI